MNTLFANAPKINPKSPDCVRFDKKRGKYELVVHGQVKATISRFGMTVPGCRTKFFESVRAAAANRRTDALVDRLFPDKPTD